MKNKHFKIGNYVWYNKVRCQIIGVTDNLKAYHLVTPQDVDLFVHEEELKKYEDACLHPKKEEVSK